MRIRPGEVERWTKARVISCGSADFFLSVAIDSRECPANALFVALRGKRTDGHRYLLEAWKRGARGALVEENGVFLPDFTVFRVNDTGQTLKVLGEASSRRLNGTRLAFTGTVGKTTTKQFFHDLLLTKFRVEATPRSFNTVVGMSVALCNYPEQSDYYLLEAGISQPGEMAELASLAQPEIVIFTPFGAGHLEGLTGVEQVAREKIRLVCEETRDIYLYAGNLRWPVVQDLVDHHDHSIITFGGLRESGASIFLEDFLFDPEEFRAQASFRFGTERFVVHPAVVSPEVALLLGPAIHFARECGIGQPEITERIESISLLPGRETLFRFGPGVVIDDTYNANPVSMHKSIQLLDAFRQKGYEVWAVLGDMFELGRYTEEAHEELVRHLLEKRVDRSILLGDALHKAADRVFSAETGGEVFLVSSHEEVRSILQERLSMSRHKWVVLFKGSRGMEMELAVPPEWRKG